MKKIEQMTVLTTNREVVFKEPSKDNALSRYKKELPEEFKKVDFMNMSEYWQFRQVEAYCEFMKEVLPNSVHKIMKGNTMLGCALAEVGFKNFSYEGLFPSTYENFENHKVKYNINFTFDYNIENTAEPKTDVELVESDNNEEKEEFDRGNKITNVWNNSEGVIRLAHKVFNDFPDLKESDKLVMTAAILNNIQNAIDVNAETSEVSSSGFSNDNLDKNSELAKQMECANMLSKMKIESPKYVKKSKNSMH